MKEKTFEELFHEALDSDEPYGAFTIPTKKQQAILKLLQQVREATIAECRECLTFTQAGYWIENGYHYYTWTNNSGQALDINSFVVDFGSGICQY